MGPKEEYRSSYDERFADPFRTRMMRPWRIPRERRADHDMSRARMPRRGCRPLPPWAQNAPVLEAILSAFAIFGPPSSRGSPRGWITVSPTPQRAIIRPWAWDLSHMPVGGGWTLPPPNTNCTSSQ